MGLRGRIGESQKARNSGLERCNDLSEDSQTQALPTGPHCLQGQACGCGALCLVSGNGTWSGAICKPVLSAGSHQSLVGVGVWEDTDHCLQKRKATLKSPSWIPGVQSCEMQVHGASILGISLSFSGAGCWEVLVGSCTQLGCD